MPFFRAITDFDYGIFNASKGSLIDTTEERGADLLNHGYVERVPTADAIAEVAGETPAPIEQATNEPQRETAALRSKRKPRNVGTVDDDPDTGALFE